MNAILKKLNSKKSGKKGFTLMEMLIVVAIIAILVAIAIPTFNSALTEARIAADTANLRGFYAEEMMDYLLNDVQPDEVEEGEDTVTVAGADIKLNGTYSATWDGTAGTYDITYINGKTTVHIPGDTVVAD